MARKKRNKRPSVGGLLLGVALNATARATRDAMRDKEKAKAEREKALVKKRIEDRKAKERAIKLALQIKKEKQMTRKRELEIQLLQRDLAEPPKKTTYGKGLDIDDDLYFDECERCGSLYPGHMKQLRCGCGGELHSNVMDIRDVIR